MVNVNNDKTEKWYKQTSDCVEFVLHDNELKLFKSSHYIKTQFLTCDYDVNYIAIVYHDKDYDEIEGRAEFPHYHVILYLERKLQFKTLIDLVMQLFHCNENQIGLQKICDLGEMSRYLVHRGYPNKHPYSLSIVETNNFDLYMKYYNMTSIKDVFDCVTVCDVYNYNLREIMTHVSNYNRWKSYIKDLIQDNRFRKY